MIASLVRRLEHISPSTWRWICAAYFLILTTGTHWPGMRFGRPGIIPVDKILHCVAFCGLAGFLMLTRWLDRSAPRAFATRNIGRSAILTLILAGLDELTQALPGEDRFPGWDDFAADAIGITLAVLVALLVFRRIALSPAE